ncbi:MAG: lysozyme inhibitor LprI family protein [Roseovarius sp.]
MRGIIFAALMLPAPGMAQDLAFDIAPLEMCLRDGGGMGCAGAAAALCMEQSPGGETTVGMGGCLDRERAYWDDQLNAVYREVIERAADLDVNASEYAPKQAEALRDMQRAWIGYRDAKCSYVASQWGGGTGAGPASVSCHLHETARQMLYLQSSQLGE